MLRHPAVRRSTSRPDGLGHSELAGRFHGREKSEETFAEIKAQRQHPIIPRRGSAAKQQPLRAEVFAKQFMRVPRQARARCPHRAAEQLKLSALALYPITRRATSRARAGL